MFSEKLFYSPSDKLSLFADLQYRNINYEVNGTENELNNLDLADKMNFFNPKVGATYFVKREEQCVFILECGQ